MYLAQTYSPSIIIAPKLDLSVPSSGPSSHRFSSSSQNSLDFKKKFPFLPPMARTLGRIRPTGTKLKKLLGLNISFPLPRAFVFTQKISTLARTSPCSVSTPPATKKKSGVAAHPGPFLFVIISGQVSTSSHCFLGVEYSRTLFPLLLPIMTKLSESDSLHAHSTSKGVSGPESQVSLPLPRKEVDQLCMM